MEKVVSLEQVQVILPRRDADTVLDQDLPFVYLVGPVLGGFDWQLRMLREVLEQVGAVIIAVPCRWQDHHCDAFRYTTIGTTTEKFRRQLDWEQHYIEKALTRKKSCVICFLAEESPVDPRTDGNPYGRDTYGEIGYFRGLYRYNRALRFVIGADSAFKGLDVIQRNFDYTHRSSSLNTSGTGNMDFTIWPDMKATVKAALPFLS